MGSFEINSAELGTIISQYQRIGRDLSNYSGRIRREAQRLNSQKGFRIETVRNNLTHLSSNSKAHSRDAYIFGGFLKDLETESTNAENQVSKGMYDATPTKMSLTQLVAGALAILVGFVFTKPLIAPIAAWLAALINNKGGKAPGSGNAPTPSQPPKPVFPTDSKPNAGDSSTGGSSTGSSGTTGGSVVGGAVAGGMAGGAVAGGATETEKEPAENSNATIDKSQVVSKNAYLTEEEMQTNAKYISQYLQKNGWSNNAIAALIANLEAESTLSPGRYEVTNRSNPGFGLVQWTPPNSDFFAWAEKKGLDPYDIDTQLQCITGEVDKVLDADKTTGVNLWQGFRTDENMTFKEFTTSELSPEELSRIFLKCYERPQDQGQSVIDGRAKLASKWNDYLNQ